MDNNPQAKGALMSRSWLTPAGFGAVLLAFGVVGYMPYAKETARLRAQIASRKAELASKTDASRQLLDLTRQQRFARLTVRNYDRLVPASQDLGSFLEELSTVLDEAGMRDTMKRALAVNRLGKCQQLPIEVHGVGTFPSFRSFLEKLESLPRMSSVTKLSIEADPSINGQLTMDMTLSIYSTKH